jgi:hypothetical protein
MSSGSGVHRKIAEALRKIDQMIESAATGEVMLNAPHKSGKRATKSDMYARISYVAGLQRAREVMAKAIKGESDV